METLAVVVGWIVAVFIGLMGAIILWYIWSDRIDLSKLISEPDGNGDASLSRFQFLIFTFVIAMSLLVIVVCRACQTGAAFPNIPSDMFALLGISGGSYVISKGIQRSNPPTQAPPEAPAAPQAPAPPAPAA
jgi:hypothetical protein